MKTLTTINTILGEVQIESARIGRARGYGQYTISVEIYFEGKFKTIQIHSTDSRLFDEANGEDNHSEIVMNGAKYVIERAVEDYISNL